ncbi:hypothetical protein CP500_016765 [Tychonema bourrellyi FEM_GT703]|uniref:Uncharacterized protein n=1 Tax=Tychonema bourrellyi FEM_GT703 TaxID=2040638 RepID=A0A2G4EXW5_9CYAN|nr:hypothetical protein [Tychonema bourrellyi]PHX54326.1 hypothetical protein CP500_016765 [Tychonema bourrellyi FEM_GT703]
MTKMTARQIIIAIVAIPIALMTQTASFAISTTTNVSPIKQVLPGEDEIDFDNLPSQSISIEESEDWDNSNFLADFDMLKTEIMESGVRPEITSPPPKLYISAARGRSSRSCRISGICE